MIQFLLRRSVLFRADLCVNGAQDKQGARFLKSHCLLARWDAGQGIIPLEINPNVSIDREKSTFNEIQQIVVAEEQRHSSIVPGWCPACLVKKIEEKLEDSNPRPTKIIPKNSPVSCRWNRKWLLHNWRDLHCNVPKWNSRKFPGMQFLSSPLSPMESSEWKNHDHFDTNPPRNSTRPIVPSAVANLNWRSWVRGRPFLLVFCLWSLWRGFRRRRGVWALCWFLGSVCSACFAVCLGRSLIGDLMSPRISLKKN